MEYCDPHACAEDSEPRYFNYLQCLSLHSKSHNEHYHTGSDRTVLGKVFKDYLTNRLMKKLPTFWSAQVGRILTIPIFVVQEKTL